MLPAPGGSTDTPWCNVKAILDKSCAACHTTPPAAGAPFPLTTYSELTAEHPTKPGKKIYERVGVRVPDPKGKSLTAPVNDGKAVCLWIKLRALGEYNERSTTKRVTICRAGCRFEAV